MKHWPSTHSTESWMTPMGSKKKAMVVSTHPKMSIATALHTVMLSFLSFVMVSPPSEMQQDDENCDNRYTNG